MIVGLIFLEDVAADSLYNLLLVWRGSPELSPPRYHSQRPVCEHATTLARSTNKSYRAEDGRRLRMEHYARIATSLSYPHSQICAGLQCNMSVTKLGERAPENSTAAWRL